MRVNVRSLLSEQPGDLIPVEIDPNDQISGLKTLLRESYSEVFPMPEAFMLVLNDVLLEDTKTVLQYNCVEDDTIFAVHDVLYGDNIFNLLDFGVEANVTEKDTNAANSQPVDASEEETETDASSQGIQSVNLEGTSDPVDEMITHEVNTSHAVNISVVSTHANASQVDGASPAPIAQGPTSKLMVPKNFHGEQDLVGFSIHRMKKSGQLQSKIDSSPPKWLSKLEAYTLLSNHAIFGNGEIEDIATGNRVDGLCGIFEYNPSGTEIQFTDYDTLKSSSVEKWRPQLQISEEICLNRNEISGDVWIRRRLSLPEHPRYQLLQWKKRGTKQKDHITGVAVETAQGAHARTRNSRAMDNDITQQLTEMKTLLRELSQSVSAQLLSMSTKIQSLQETHDKILELLNVSSPSKVPSPPPASTTQQHPAPASTSQQHQAPASTSQQHSMPQLHPGSSPSADQA